MEESMSIQHAQKPEPARYRIAGMDCGSCAVTLEKSIARLPGVERVEVNFATELMEILGQVDRRTLEARVAELGYSLVDDADAGAAEPDADLPELRGISGFVRFLWHDPITRFALLAGSALILMVPWMLLSADGSKIAFFISGMYLLVTLIAGFPVLRKGLRSVVYARRITIDLLMGIAVIGAMLIGATGEAVTVILLFTLGEALEKYSAERSRDSLRGLFQLQPSQATVLRGHAGPESEHYHRSVIPIEELAVGDRILVKPGERIPVDGTICAGVSTIDQSAITGESMPVRREIGDEVYGGTVNGEAVLQIIVTRSAENATIARIARLIEQAQLQRSPAERFIDRFARWYTPAVVLLTIAVVLIPTLGFGQPFLDTPDGTHGWLYRGLTLLIIACPCALVISIPVTVVSALTRLAQLGVLVKGGSQLDEINRIRVFAFDKTGTLTRGRPEVAAMKSMACEHPAAVAQCDECDDMLALAAAVESGSEHPLAHAVLSEASSRHVQDRYQPATGITAHAGKGVCGKTNGNRIAVGSQAMFSEKGHDDVELPPDVLTSGKQHSLMIVAREKNVLGYIEVEDQPREGSIAALKALREISPEIHTVMLTGDNTTVADGIAQRIGAIDDVRANLLPEQKLDAIREMEKQYGHVAMVGDGINDAPALAAARIGIAMGAGSAQAMETADVVLMQDDLSRLPTIVRISRRTRRVLKENIALSLGLKLAFLALAIPGIATLWMAVVADVGATLLVTLNGMRLLRDGGRTSITH